MGNVGALVTLVAAVHYFYMREFWITIGTSPILYRYRLVYHGSFANGRILFHSHGSQTRSWSRNVLPFVLGNLWDVGFRLLWRGSFHQRLGGIHPRLERLGIHLVRDLCR